MKILPFRPDLFNTDGRTQGQTDMTKLMVAFRNFSIVPKNVARNLVINCDLRRLQLKMQRQVALGVQRTAAA